LVEAIDYDFDKLRAARSSIVGCCLRGLCLDGWVRDFLARHPGATVVELGPGLDDRFERVDDGRVRWYDLDLPDAMALRQRFFRESDRRTFLATSALDLGWMDRVDLGHGPLLIVAEAVIIYFSEAEARSLLRAAADRFPGAVMLLDVVSPLMYRRQERHEMLKHTSARFGWSLPDPGGLEGWDDRIVVEEARTLADVIRSLPRASRRSVPALFRVLFSMVPPLRDSYHLVRVRLGSPSAPPDPRPAEPAPE
jgi:O-methyltransferase involved in polyketide biosynthesis